MDKAIDVTKLKYALYVRKSTDDPERQVRSIDDQIAECLQLAERLGLRIVKPHIIEHKSAKRPNQRPLFTQMLKDLRAGKYDGILTWAPDRLARTMREGGEVIDMLDEGYIKDLKFVTYTFSNDPNGKMLLGMAFVLSKQYSDKLSQDVTRGVSRSFSEGKTGTPKHGYIRDAEGLYRPDGKNFELISEAWERRREGQSLEQIATWMNEQGYGRIIKRTGRRVDMDFRILTDIFKDPLYYGILLQKGQKVDLRDLYNFVPATTEETYIAVQQLYYHKKKPYSRRRTTFYHFKMMIFCAFCQRPMYVGPSASKTKSRYLYFRCDNVLCTRQKKSIRSKVILDHIYQLLEHGLQLTEADYRAYHEKMTTISQEKKERLAREAHSKQAQIKYIDKEVTDKALKLVDIPRESTVYRVNEKRITELEEQKEDLTEQVNALKQQLEASAQDRLSIDDFLNLARNAAKTVKSADAIVKDKICRLIFLNFVVDEEKVLSYQAKPPFDTVLERGIFVSSRGAGN